MFLWSMSATQPELSSPSPSPPASAAKPTFWLTRFVLLRFLGFIYFIAFLCAVKQIVPLVGQHGLTPADPFLTNVASHAGSTAAGFVELPTVFWFGISDDSLLLVSWVGLILSLVVLAGYANALIMLALWALYMSIVHIGQIWYSFGWETQLLETGFLAVFFCPLLDARPFPRRAPPVVVIWLYRWLIFRIMIGAGLIKLRGDPCWRDLTCLYYHYETQPIPSPASWWLHFRPHWFHTGEVLWNHFIELIVPWGMAPWRYLPRIAGLLMISFQATLVISGNLSFLNWLTIVPCLACLDDGFWALVLPKFLVRRAQAASARALPSNAMEFAAVALALVVGLLSIQPVMNLFSERQQMNASFDPLDLVNTYGAFGSVGRERFEIIFEGTRDRSPDNATWHAYEFVAKPGDPQRRPPFIAPYQPRLDWEIWFAAMGSYEQYPWTLHFVWKLLHNDSGTLSLLAGNPFPGEPPRYIRAQLYRYRFTRPDEHDGTWWHRELVGPWLPALSAENADFRRVLALEGWLDGG
jgi:hypothetical protein